jgi:hypothetical protein
MYFMQRDGWHCQFLEPDLKTPLRRTLRFRDPDKIRDMHEHFGEERQLAHKQALEYGIESGRGSIWLLLTDEQYQTLKRKT